MSSTIRPVPAGPNSASSSHPRISHKREHSDSEEANDRGNRRPRCLKRARSVTGTAEEAKHDESAKEKKRRRKRCRQPHRLREMTVQPVVERTSSGSGMLRRRSRSRDAPVVGPFGGMATNRSTPELASSSTLGTDISELTEISTASDKGKSRAFSPVATSESGDSKELSAMATEIADLKAQLAAKTNLISRQTSLLSSLQHPLTCQICLDPLYKPYALAPCGHISCYTCLLSWFNAPPADIPPEEVLPTTLRKKTCPHCRAVVRDRPIEIWLVKDMVTHFLDSGLANPPMNLPPVPLHLPPADDASTASDDDVASEEGATTNASTDPWAGVFFKPAGRPLLFPDPAPPAVLQQMMGIHDAEDGGVYRCVDCMHEIWDGVCSSCGRMYPGHDHAPHAPDFDPGPLDWLGDDGDEDEDEDEGDADHGGLPAWHGFHFPGLGMPLVGWLPDPNGGTDDEVEEDEDEGNWHLRDLSPPAVDLHIQDLSTPAVEAGSEHRSEDSDEDEEGYESSFVDDDGGDGDDQAGFRARLRRLWDGEGAGFGHDNEEDTGGAVEDGDVDGNADDEYDAPVPLRRSRRMVQCVSSEDDDVEDPEPGDASEVEGGDSEGSANSLAAQVAEVEGDLYGDDGSLSRVRHLSPSFPIEIGDSDEENHGMYVHQGDSSHCDYGDDGYEDEEGDEPARHSFEQCEDPYHTDGESMYDEHESGDEYEYGDESW